MNKKIFFTGIIYLLFSSGLLAQELSSEKVFISLEKKPEKAPQEFFLGGSGATILNEGEQNTRYYALVIGINNYSDPAINSLDKPIRDARRLYEVLTERYLFNKKDVQLLENPSRKDIIYALDYLAKVVHPEDNLLIFYAGHGWWDEDALIGYWLPSDAKKISKADWFRNSTLVDYLREIESKHTLLITDACFGGSIFKTRKAFSDAPKDIAALYEFPSRKAMTSGSLTEVPDESPFMKYLIERLNKNKGKYLSSEELFISLKTAVVNNSETEPLFGEIRNVGDQGGDFIFIRK